MKPFEELIGKTINKIYFGKHKDCLKLDYYTYVKLICDNNQEMIYYLEADCCSESYFTNIEDIPKQVFPLKIYNVYYIGDIQCGKSMKQDEDKIYFIIFNRCDDDYTNDTATFYISFRNSSNGYYKGDIKLLEETHPFYKAQKNYIIWGKI